MKFFVDFGNERTQMKLLGELSGIEISDRSGLDFAWVNPRVVERFATGFLDYVAQGLCLLFEVPLSRFGPRRDVDWFVHNCGNLSHGNSTVIPSRRRRAARDPSLLQFAVSDQRSRPFQL